MTTEKVLYATSATVQGGREGKVTSADGHLELQLSTPKELGGNGGQGTNPEQLFAAGYSACFQSALGLVARRERIDTSNSTITGSVTLHPNGDGGFKLGVALEVTIPGVEQRVGEHLLELAHKVCPYSNAVRGNVDVELTFIEG
ncbi:organic hydroperoxide resistance protein [Chloroflexia bacterium SDU3-3]|nr:organic hydroperoxide resistance protein [Chloroflexia bacterium SDU3-3]